MRSGLLSGCLVICCLQAASVDLQSPRYLLCYVFGLHILRLAHWRAQKDSVPCRALMTAALRRAFADAAGGGRAGTLKDIMTAQYARLAQALEDVIRAPHTGHRGAASGCAPAALCACRHCMLCNWGSTLWRKDSLRLLDEVRFDEFLPLCFGDESLCPGRSRGWCQG